MLRLPAFLLLLLLASPLCQAQTVRDYAAELSAEANVSPPSITLKWADYALTDYVIVSRKARNAASWTVLDTVFPPATTWVDNNVALGEAWEYRVRRVGVTTPTFGVSANGYVYAGVRRELEEQRGKLLLLVDSTYAAPLDSLLQQLRWDLVADGWRVLRQDVPRSATPAQVRSLLQNLRAQHPDFRGTYILGHVPVPYSGNLAPDGHMPDHQGAWPADVYYAELTANWPDATVNSTGATRSIQHNIPGDGKPDASQLSNLNQPGQVEKLDAFVGRIDFVDLPAFAQSDTALMANYLAKAHAYRTGQWRLPMRALVEDNFGIMGGEAFGANGYRNFAALLGGDSVFTLDYRSTLQNNGYLCSYGTGGGTYTSAGGIISTGELATDNLQTAFTMLFGSYHGDWDTQNNLLRAAIASGSHTLTVCWAGRPNWFVHHLGQGEPWGSAYLSGINGTLGSGNNLYSPTNSTVGGVHQALLGDPSLRLQYPDMPANLVATPDSATGTIALAWTAPPGAESFQLFRSPSPDSPFVRINTFPILGTAYTDSLPLQGTNWYMVRHRALATNGSGSYYNLSTGVLDSTFIQYTPTQRPATLARGIRAYPNPADASITVELPSPQALLVFNALGQLQASLNAQATHRLNTAQWPAGIYTLQSTGLAPQKMMVLH